MGEDQVVSALLQGTFSDIQEASFLGLTAFAETFGDVGWDRNGSPAHLMGQPELLPVGKRFSQSINRQYELMRFLPDHQIPEAVRGWSLARHSTREAFTGVIFQVSHHTGGRHERLFRTP